MIHTTDSIGGIAVKEPPSVEIFDRAGIEYCCHGRQTLEEACSGIALAPQEVAQALQSYDKDILQQPMDWRRSTLEFLILQVLSRSHTDLKSELRQAETIAVGMTDRHGSRHPQFRVIRQLIEELSSGLTAHMEKEETIVFPALLNLELAYLGEGSASRLEGELRALLKSMADEYLAVGKTLAQLPYETDGFCPPSRSDKDHAEFYGQLLVLYRGLRQDLHMENNVLFPRVAQMEKELFRGFRSPQPSA